MSDFNINHITGKQGQQGTVLAGITTVNSTGSMRIPSGPTENRGGRGRMVFGGGYFPAPHANLGTMDYVEIATLGNAIDFGDYTLARYAFNMGSSSTRGLFAAGGYPGRPNTGAPEIDYITFQSQGGANEFGDLSILPVFKAAGFGNGVRGVFAGGYDGNSPYGGFTHIQYVNIASTGNSSFFGDLSVGSRTDMSVADRTRGCIGGLDIGSNPSTTETNIIEYVTTATTGNSKDFGDLTVGRVNSNGCSSSTTRGLFYSGSPGPGIHKNTIDYITIQTKGNATDFGDMTNSGNSGGSAHGSNLTRSVNHDSGAENIVEYVTITSTGNTQDFGDLTRSSVTSGGVDNSNGSIGQ
tara:strand:+ start:976 stop:2034 length:1059 start_codon:yes stop_codon:yes gene_type:complete